MSSSVSPEFDSISTTSSGVIMPRSPCDASAGCTKNAGVPVEASVAASLRAMCPDLPMPDTDDAPAAIHHQRDRGDERFAEALCKPGNRRGLRGEHVTREGERTRRVDAGAGRRGLRIAGDGSGNTHPQEYNRARRPHMEPRTCFHVFTCALQRQRATDARREAQRVAGMFARLRPVA